MACSLIKKNSLSVLTHDPEEVSISAQTLPSPCIVPDVLLCSVVWE